MPLDITLEHGTPDETATADQLRRIVTRWNVDRWIETRSVVVDERAIPHSHPVLTLHARYLGDDAGLLATFLHEQFHWREEGNAAFAAAMDDFEVLFPDAPVGGSEGARDRQSTYRHLVVCDLEYQAMTELFGQAKAREVLSANGHYTWIYEQVLNDPRVRSINLRHGMTVR